jgi:hypothetical protein
VTKTKSNLIKTGEAFLVLIMLVSLLMQAIPVASAEETTGVSANQGLNTGVSPLAEVVVTFPDAGLESAIRDEIGKPTGDIYQSDLDSLNFLFAFEYDISSLLGIEHCGNLSYLILGYNRIIDISSLSSLTNLIFLDLQNNIVSNSTGLGGLTKLEELYLNSNRISDISPLSTLTNLTNLNLGDNLISSLDPIAGLTKLEELGLQGNQISNITSLTPLIQLDDLRLSHNLVDDISPLTANSGISQGDYVDLSYNNLDLTAGSSDRANIQELIDRGAEVKYVPQNQTSNNKAPVVSLGSDVSIYVGNEFNYNGSFTDTDSTSWTAVVNYGYNPGNIALTLNKKSFTLSHVFAVVGVFTVTVTVTDDEGASGSDSLIVTVKENDLNIIPDSIPDGEVKVFYSQTLDLVNGINTYTWSWKADAGSSLPSGLKLKANKDTLSAVISGKPSKAGTFNFTVTAVDKKDKTISFSRSYEISIYPALILTAPKPVPAGEELVDYSLELSVSEGFGPYNWTISKGDLPLGLTLNSVSAASAVSGSSVKISGSPNHDQVGSYKFTVQVIDSFGGTASKTLTIKIYDSLSINEITLLPCDIDVAYKSATLKATGGNKKYKWTIVSGALPNGLSLSEKGVITGKPVLGSSGKHSFVVRVGDGIGIADREFTLTINDPLTIVIDPPVNDNVTTGDNCSYTLTPGGGSLTGYKWSKSGTLPKGLTFDTKTGVISGTYLKAETYTFTIKLTDSLKGKAEYTKTIVVK